jgi:hypothetical protein
MSCRSAVSPQGALDSFLVDELLPEVGPTAFISQLYPTIFREP